MFKRDFLGKPVYVGDTIFYSTTGRYATSRLCIVSRLTDKSMFVQVIKENRTCYTLPKEEVIVKNDFIKVDASDFTNDEKWPARGL
jgi:hypothetical protein